jgi:hypothetical protein
VPLLRKEIDASHASPGCDPDLPGTHGNALTEYREVDRSVALARVHYVQA